MADLLGNDTDYEMDKYLEASLISEAGINPAIEKNKKSVFNPETNTHDILLPMSQGGYIKIGEEGETVDPPKSILIEGMEFGPETPEFQRYYPAPQPEVMETAPASLVEPTTESAPIEGAVSFANERKAATGAMPTMEDFDAAGYTPDVVEAAGLMGPQEDLTLSPDEIARKLTSGEPFLVFGEGDPTIREAGTRVVEDLAVRLATEGMRTELLEEQGVSPTVIEEAANIRASVEDETNPSVIQEAEQRARALIEQDAAQRNAQVNFRTIDETIRAATGSLRSSASVYSNALFGTGETNPLEVGVADFATFGALDIQEGYRMFSQSNQGAPISPLYATTGLALDAASSIASAFGSGDGASGSFQRLMGLGLMAAGVAEATVVGKPIAALMKKGFKVLEPSLIKAGAEAEQRIAQEGSTMFSNPVGPIVDRGLAAAGRLAAPDVTDGLPGRISTRLPTAKASTEDPMTGDLIVGLEEMKADPKLYEFNVNITKDYPNMKVVEGEGVDETSERFIAHVTDNLLHLHDQVPEATRVRSQKWYDGARAITDRWSSEYNVPDTSIAGALAALSPQKDWYQNVSLAQRVLDVSVKQRDFKFADDMEQTFRSLPSLNKPKYEPMLEAIKGKSYAEIVDEDPAVQSGLRALFVRLYDQTYNSPDYKIVGPEGEFLQTATNADGRPSKAAWGSLNEIGKAVASIDVNGDVSTISRLMGERHKVRNFYNNIYDPNSPFGDVTIDTHAVAAGLLRPLSGNSLEVDHNFKNMSVKGRGTTKGSSKTGVSGNYGLYAEAYRRAAAERGILPRQMQSITWEAVRGLFTDKFKQSAKNVSDVNAIWQRYKDGEIDLNETRRLVDERAGGVNPPTWE
jgi:hypothetical protein